LSFLLVQAKSTAEATSTTKVEVDKSAEQVVVTSKIEIKTPTSSPVKVEGTTSIAVEQQVKVEMPSSQGDDDCLIVKAENVVTVTGVDAVKVEDGASSESFASGTGNDTSLTPEKSSVASALPARAGSGRMGAASTAGLRRSSSRMGGNGINSMEVRCWQFDYCCAVVSLIIVALLSV
jgi:hypothetical protein